MIVNIQNNQIPNTSRKRLYDWPFIEEVAMMAGLFYSRKVPANIVEYSIKKFKQEKWTYKIKKLKCSQDFYIIEGQIKEQTYRTEHWSKREKVTVIKLACAHAFLMLYSIHRRGGDYKEGYKKYILHKTCSRYMFYNIVL